MSGIKGATVLIGGGSEALDAIDGATLSDGDAARVTTSSGVYHYHLNASSGATENSPYVISPDNNAGTKRWILVTPAGAFSHVHATRGSSQAIATSTLTTVIFATEVHDILSEYNNATGEFTALYDGYYSVSAACLLDTYTWASGDDMDVFFYVDGVGITSIRPTNNYSRPARLHLSLNSPSLYIAAGEVLTFRVWHDQGGSVNISADTTGNFLMISRLA